MDNNNIVNKNVPAISDKLMKDLSTHGHNKLTAGQMDLQEVIDGFCDSYRLKNGVLISTFYRAWLRRDIEEYLTKKGIDLDALPEREVPPVPAAGMVTDKQKAEYVVEKTVWELRKLRQMTNGVPSTGWADMERKARKLLNEFGNDIGTDRFSVNLLFDIMALFMHEIFKNENGAWTNKAGKK